MQKNLKFEQALEQLEEMVKKLEEGSLPLEESLKVFEEGIQLTKFCEQKLNEAEGRVEMVLKGEPQVVDVKKILEGTANTNDV